MSHSDHRRFDLESLEQRLLLSADGFGVGMQDDLLRAPEMVVEVEAGVQTRVAGAGQGDSIFGDFEVEVSLGACRGGS